MRTTMIILLAIGLVSLSGCEQKTDPNAMLENSETRSQIFNSISDNQEYMSELMATMQNSQQAMQMMQGNQKNDGCYDAGQWYAGDDEG